MRERCGRQASSIIESAVVGARRRASCDVRPTGEGAPDGGSRQRRGALARIGARRCRRVATRARHAESALPSSRAAGCSSPPRSSAPCAGRIAARRARRTACPGDRGACRAASRRRRARRRSSPRSTPARSTPALCLVSEKYDGVRALWDGRVLRHRSGRAVSAPRVVPRRACRAAPLDGELWLGRGRFDALSAIVPPRRAGRARVARGRYMVFDMPVGAGLRERGASASGGPDAARCRRGSRSRRSGASPTGPTRRALARTVAAGGEGLMLHVADAAYVRRPQRSADEAEAPPRRRGRRRRSPRAAPASTAGSSARSRSRSARGPALLHRQRPQRRAAARSAGDRHDGHLPLSRADVERPAALRDLPAAARRRLSRVAIVAAFCRPRHDFPSLPPRSPSSSPRSPPAAPSSPRPQPGSEPTSTREYRTGSNIPVREPRSTTSEEKAAPPAADARARPIRPQAGELRRGRAARRYFSGSAMKPIRVSPAFWTMPISSATRP